MNQMAKKVYVSMPKSGKTLGEIREKQTNLIGVIERVIGESVEILYPSRETSLNDKPLSLLLDNLTLINEADYIAFVEGWTEEAESRIEHEIVIMYGLPYAEVSDESTDGLTIKIYVSCIRNGKSETELESEYHEISRKVYNTLKQTIPLAGVKVVNKSISAGMKPIEELHERLKQMNESDYVIFKEGSENEREGYIERKCAEEYGLPYYEESGLKE